MFFDLQRFGSIRPATGEDEGLYSLSGAGWFPGASTGGAFYIPAKSTNVIAEKVVTPPSEWGGSEADFPNGHTGYRPRNDGPFYYTRDKDGNICYEPGLVSYSIKGMGLFLYPENQTDPLNVRLRLIQEWYIDWQGNPIDVDELVGMYALQYYIEIYEGYFGDVLRLNITIHDRPFHADPSQPRFDGSRVVGYHLAAGTVSANAPNIPIANNAWYKAISGDKWGWLSAYSATTQAERLIDNDSAVTVWITGVSNVTGNAYAATATLASGVAVSDVTVTGSGAGYLTLTIDDTEYTVSNNKLVAYAITINGAQWRNATPSGTAKWVYLPAGAVAKVNANSGNMVSTSTTVLQITGVSNVTGDAASATATLSGALADVTVTGSAASSVIITVDGTEYYVSGNKLTALYTVINGAQWLENDGSYVFLPAGVSAQISNKTGAMVSTDTTTLQITGVSGVSGNARTATITLAGEISDVTVTGAAVRDVIIKIGVIKYSVNENGKLVQAVLAPPTTQIISIVEKGGAESSQQKLDYLNPKASDEQISTFMNALNSLTVNKTTKTIRVDKRTIL